MVQLIALHGLVGAEVPLASGITLEITFTNQRLLNFLRAFRL